MVRQKIPMRLIGNARARARTFAQRKAGLMKKARELSTLCGVDVAVVCAGPDGGAPDVWASKDGPDGVIERYRKLPAKKREELTHLNHLKGELCKEKVRLARVRQGGPRALASCAEALKDMSPEKLQELLGSIDAALLATAARRKALGMPADDDDADDGQLRPFASDAVVPCIDGDFEDMDSWIEELMGDGDQHLPPNAGTMQLASGVQHINGDSFDIGGNQYLQLQMPGDGDNDQHCQFAWDANQLNAIVHPGCDFQSIDSNYAVMNCSQMQVPDYSNVHDGWLNLAMWGTDESLGNAIVPVGHPTLDIAGDSVNTLAEHHTMDIGDNFTGTQAIDLGSNFMDENGYGYATQCLADDFQCSDFSQRFRLEPLHYLSNVAEGIHF